MPVSLTVRQAKGPRAFCPSASMGSAVGNGVEVVSDAGSERQMAFVAGPRQVGKTHSCRSIGDTSLDWDDDDHRDVILQGPAAVACYANAQILSTWRRIVVLDELYKYAHWKRFLKGLFDTLQERLQFVVTGLSRRERSSFEPRRLTNPFAHQRLVMSAN